MHPCDPSPAERPLGPRLGRLIGQDGPDTAPFALIHRPESGDPDTVELLAGPVEHAMNLDDIPRPGESPGITAVVLVPYRQISERGFHCNDDGAPVLVLRPSAHHTIALGDVLAALPQNGPALSAPRFEPGDEEYASIVRRVVAEEIGRGEGANFVIRRSLLARLAEPALRPAAAAYRRLLEQERGTYWTFLVHTGDRTFVGATPERHISLRAGVAAMNPISGTLRYPPDGVTLHDVLMFLKNHKETDELSMVVDEELKMMATVCPDGGTVRGPYLKEMADLAHTEYVIEGRSDASPARILRASMFAPTVTGSPLENACRVIARHETRGRRYYSGVIAMIGRDPAGDDLLDSAIIIRTAEVDRTGRIEIGTGATLVRRSVPEEEAAETRAKTAGLLRAFTADPAPAAAARAGGSGGRHFGDEPEVHRELAARNTHLAPYWFGTPVERRTPVPELAGRRVVVIDAEDTFTHMLAQQVRSLGAEVTIRRYDEDDSPGGSGRTTDLTVLGPGPGDPRAVHDPKIAALRHTAERLLRGRRPLLAVCLSHQVLCTMLGLRVIRRASPNQGVQLPISYFGRSCRVGFYNTFSALAPADRISSPLLAGPAEVCCDPRTREVHALRAPGAVSFQFHAESLLTQDGPRLIAEALAGLAAEPR